MSKREPGVDLFRCLGLLFVTGLHSFLYNGFYSEVQVGVAMWAANSFRWLFSGCNGMFMLLTGYLKSHKPLNRHYYKGLLTVFVGYALTCVISYPIRHFLLGESASPVEWAGRFFTFDGYAWYIAMYFGLILFSPILNLAMDQLQSNVSLIWLAGTMVVLTSLPSLTPLYILPEYWTALYPMTYYVLGAVIRRMDFSVKGPVCLLLSLLTASFMGLLSTITAAGGVFTDGFRQGGNGGFLTTVMVTTLFLGVYRIRIPLTLQRLAAWLSSGILEGYLLSRLLDVWVYDLFPQWHSPGWYMVLFLCVTVPVFLLSSLAGKLVHSLSVRIVKSFGI